MKLELDSSHKAIKKVLQFRFNFLSNSNQCKKLGNHFNHKNPLNSNIRETDSFIIRCIVSAFDEIINNLRSVGQTSGREVLRRNSSY